VGISLHVDQLQFDPNLVAQLLDKDRLAGTLVGVITDEDLDGVASGAIFSNALYVNNARYSTFPEPDTEYVLTRLKIKSTKWVP
jgi:single-stranded DNA-specific DHH superfamily exonuclease